MSDYIPPDVPLFLTPDSYPVGRFLSHVRHTGRSDLVRAGRWCINAADERRARGGHLARSRRTRLQQPGTRC